MVDGAFAQLALFRLSLDASSHLYKRACLSVCLSILLRDHKLLVIVLFRGRWPKGDALPKSRRASAAKIGNLCKRGEGKNENTE